MTRPDDMSCWEPDDADDLRAAKGIGLGVLLSLPVWVAGYALARWLWRLL